MYPRISVIVPAFNAADTIADALVSVQQQVCRDFELIVVDDGSNDSTATVVHHTCPNAHLIRQANAGPAAARNAGATAASGEWLAFLDADDAWLPWRLEVQMACANRIPEAALWCSRCAPFSGCTDLLRLQSAAPIERLLAPSWTPPVGADLLHPLSLADLRYANPIPTSTVLLRRAVFHEVGAFDPQFRGPEDYDLWIRVLARHPAVKVNIPTSRYRAMGTGLSQDERRFLPEVLRAIEKAYGRQGSLRRFGRRSYLQARAYQMNAMAWAASGAGRRTAAFCLVLRSFMNWPWRFPNAKEPFSRLRILAALVTSHIPR